MELLTGAVGFITLNYKAKSTHSPSHFQGFQQRLENDEMLQQGNDSVPHLLTQKDKYMC